MLSRLCLVCGGKRGKAAAMAVVCDRHGYGKMTEWCHASLSRRCLLAGSFISVPFTQASVSYASELQGYLSRVFPPAPEPILFPRKALNQPFAVLLMRSAYETVDDLDFIPMNEFQKAFWKLRASEQEAYNLQYSPLKPRIGDVTDSLYFDFISYSQFSTISREMPQGQQVFKEYCEDCPDLYRIVRRDLSLADNSQLPTAFLIRTGDRIYAGLKDGFRGFQFGAPPPLAPGASLESITTAVQKLLDIMVDNGYALKAMVYDVNDAEQSFKVKITGPANLWGLTSLAYRRAAVLNVYDCMAIQGLLRASGLSADFDLSTSSSGIEERWVLSQRPEGGKP
ncbi:hypothetical protein VOLCADRAFT_94019 [Volvox carteri f. nagariensis]|uniref:Uncharacterized protein n=1 Tax=Volvox carteri f. nagariensis TaxID=3068 RepID=D8U3P6_VOLCA|nr:uncharacterized protein VOLCADRAFT_94019 [Volvox carteri f. nagariensis]EFJ45566.1 hypothetical protein VOLCADRAFT_94019 [Volvox carteri f. nagariensis]|eukprot:XP_002953256.1 hypothetical protein VOLCADRAFT_94019 [Volvox carteri f. nagariensis]